MRPFLIRTAADRDLVLAVVHGQRRVALEELNERAWIIGIENAGDLLAAQGLVGNANLQGVIAIELGGHVLQPFGPEDEAPLAPGDDLREIGHGSRDNLTIRRNARRLAGPNPRRRGLRDRRGLRRNLHDAFDNRYRRARVAPIDIEARADRLD